MALANPTSFSAALSEAESHCFQHLLQATAAKPGLTGFIGRSSGAVNAWTFSLSVPSVQEPHVFHDATMPALAYAARLELIYADRGDIQKAMMRVIETMPRCNFGNVVQFDIHLVGGVIDSVYAPPNEDKRWPVWTATIDFQVIFATGGRTEVA